MQLTRQTDYAIRVLMFLGVQQSDELVTISDIAHHFEISRNHLMKIVHKLGQLGYIQTVRGKYGGMRINMEAEEISIGRMIRDFETSLEIVDCEKLICPLTGSCEMKPMLKKARDAFLSVVDEYTLRDLLKNPADIRTLLGLDLKEGELPVQVMAAS